MHFFLCENNQFFILFLFILQAVDQCAGRQKVCIFSEYLPFLIGHCVESTHTYLSYPPIFYLPMPTMSSLCFGMILAEGGAVPLLPCFKSIGSVAGALGKVSRVESRVHK